MSTPSATSATPVPSTLSPAAAFAAAHPTAASVSAVDSRPPAVMRPPIITMPFHPTSGDHSDRDDQEMELIAALMKSHFGVDDAEVLAKFRRPPSLSSYGPPMDAATTTLETTSAALEPTALEPTALEPTATTLTLPSPDISRGFEAPTHLAPFVKIVAVQTDLPIRGSIKTITVIPTGANGKILRHGVDDHTYASHPELRTLVPRGYSELWFAGECRQVLMGFPKFDGVKEGDDDDVLDELDAAAAASTTSSSAASSTQSSTSSAASSTQSTSVLTRATQWQAAGELLVRYPEKANGKFAIFKLFRHGDDVYIFGGSKNKHVVAKYGDPIEGTELHWQILKAIIADLEKLSSAERASLIGKCIVGEYVDGKHLVYTATPYMVYFDAAGTSLPTPRAVLPPTTTLPTPEMYRQVRELIGSEGIVIEYANTRTGEILREKLKTEEYIIWRTWRELLLKKKRVNLEASAAVTLMRARVKSRSEQFLNLSDARLAYWYDVAEQFITWFVTTSYEYSDVGPFSQVGMARILTEWRTSKCVGGLSSTGSAASSSTGSAGSAASSSAGSTAIPTSINPFSRLEHPEYVQHIVSAFNAGFRVVVIMSGPSGSGKSTVADALCDLIGASAEIFSTDKRFMVGDPKVYVFDAALLKSHHDATLAAFVASNARVRILDNTNLRGWDFDKYMSSSVECMRYVLNLKRQPIDVLTRNVHGVPLDKLQRMLKDWKPVGPAYFGIFPAASTINAILAKHSLTSEQKTPLHITVKFVGGKLDTSPDCPELFGTNVPFSVIGYSKNPAGTCLLVETVPGLRPTATPNPSPTSSAASSAAASSPPQKILHITLTTNDGYKPVQVGEMIPVGDTVSFDSVPLTGLYTAYY